MERRVEIRKNASKVRLDEGLVDARIAKIRSSGDNLRRLYWLLSMSRPFRSELEQLESVEDLIMSY